MRVSPILYLDLETQLSAADVGGWEHASQMRVSVACAFDSVKWHFYEEDNISELIEQIRIAALVIGFNIKAFDYQVLSRYTDLDFEEVPTFDMLDEIYHQLGHRVNLDNLAHATLGMEKTGDGVGAIELWQVGEMEKLRDYCKQDVDITYRLFLAGWQDGYLLYTKDGQLTEINTESWKAKFQGLFLGV